MNQINNKKQKEMSTDEISRTVLNAYNNHQPVLIKINNVKGYIIGFIEGYLDDGVIVISNRLVDINDIKNIGIGMI